tara:strand:- start:325 stop:825 length:501 start_codon:yes stop_codon:yes gene_type:complete
MTFILLPPDKPTSTQTVGNLLSPSSIAVDSVCPCDSITHTGLTVNGSGQLVLSSTKDWVLWASPLAEANSNPYTGAMSFQWYDVTNSAYIGRPIDLWTSVGGGASARGSVARAVITPSSDTTVELRITSIVTGGIDTVNPTTPKNHWASNAPGAYVGEQWYAVLSF